MSGHSGKANPASINRRGKHLLDRAELLKQRWFEVQRELNSGHVVLRPHVKHWHQVFPVLSGRLPKKTGKMPARKNNRSTSLLQPEGQQKIMKPLDSVDAGVLNVPSLELLQPLEADLGAPGDLRPGESAVGQQAVGALKKGFGHGRSVGNRLLECQPDEGRERETHYSGGQVVFYRMPRETTKEVIETVSVNAKALAKALGWSNVKVAEMTRREVSAKSVNNLLNGRNCTLETVSAVAHSLGLDAWQLLVPGLPDKAEEREALALLVRAYLALGETARKAILNTAQSEARGEFKYDQIFGKRLPPAVGAE